MSNETLPLCGCGCGEVVRDTYRRTRSSLGHVKGQPLRFLSGHNPTHNRPIEERFWERVDKRGPDECWNWLAGKTAGYGYISVGGGRGAPRVRVHRYAYERLVGPIPDGLEIDHLCENRACVNPAHLEPVTHRDNMLRASTGLIQANSLKTHCPRGHEYSPENTYVQPDGRRRCRECARIVKREWTARKIAEAA